MKKNLFFIVFFPLYLFSNDHSLSKMYTLISSQEDELVIKQNSNGETYKYSPYEAVYLGLATHNNEILNAALNKMDNKKFDLRLIILKAAEFIQHKNEPSFIGTYFLSATAMCSGIFTPFSLKNFQQFSIMSGLTLVLSLATYLNFKKVQKDTILYENYLKNYSEHLTTILYKLPLLKSHLKPLPHSSLENLFQLLNRHLKINPEIIKKTEALFEEIRKEDREKE